MSKVVCERIILEFDNSFQMQEMDFEGK